KSKVRSPKPETRNPKSERRPKPDVERGSVGAWERGGLQRASPFPRSPLRRSDAPTLHARFRISDFGFHDPQISLAKLKPSCSAPKRTASGGRRSGGLGRWRFQSRNDLRPFAQALGN